MNDPLMLDVLREMRRKGVRRMPVVAQGGALAGLISMDDVLEVLAEQMEEAAAAIGANYRREKEHRA